MNTAHRDQFHHQEHGQHHGAIRRHLPNGNAHVSTNGSQPVNDVQTGSGQESRAISASGELEVMCGPLLNYKRMHFEGETAYWHGSVLIVTKPAQSQPRLELRYLGAITHSNGAMVNGSHPTPQSQTFEGVKLYEDPNKAFWRFSMELRLESYEARWEYSISGLRFVSNIRQRQPSRTFAVPSIHESMRLMFHSCNGFSVGTNEEAWSGPALWSDVLRVHEKRPFHVMIGGGDQIYNDGVRVNGPLKTWTTTGNPKKRKAHPFSEDMRLECDEYYFKNYVRWFSTEPFASANAQIPQINIWDDHDIIDGFGSYTDNFMKCAVFRGIGGVSFKYYCLFQHHTAPPKSTFTTDAPETMHADKNGTSGIDPRQLKDTFVMEENEDDPSWIVGKRPGPYVEERSRSLYMRLGRHMAFVGIDARTERTRHQVNYPDTYEVIFLRLSSELSAARGTVKHLIVLLGVPIAYPRLAWLENLFTSPIIAPIRLLNKRFGVAGGFFNHFDGQVDLLDDLDDHYTAKHHKRERKDLLMRLQKLSREHSVRITILGGDVHLAAMGRFYSNPKLGISCEHDHRYMANVISSAITNKPPPKAVANLLARRNKIHHLDSDTDETLMKLFDKQPGGKEKGGEWNKCTMPSRNYACITEISVPVETNGTALRNRVEEHDANAATSPIVAGKDGHSPLHRGEQGAGTQHWAADGVSSDSGLADGLNISIRVEIDQSDREGRTEGYGFSIPPLNVTASSEKVHA